MNQRQHAYTVYVFVSGHIEPPVSLSENCYRYYLNAASRIVTNRPTRKLYRGLRHTMRHDLHWLDIADRISGFAVTMYYCLLAWMVLLRNMSKLFTPWCPYRFDIVSGPLAAINLFNRQRYCRPKLYLPQFPRYSMAKSKTTHPSLTPRSRGPLRISLLNLPC